MACDCNKTYNLSMGCCVPTLAPADNYYTKYQTEKKIEEAVSGITGSTGCCITPEEVDEKISAATDGMATQEWVENKGYITGVDLSNYATKAEIPIVPTSNTAFTNDAGYLTEHQPIKTLNGQSLIGTGDIEIGTGGTIDLSNYYTTAQTVNLVESAVTRVEGEIPTVPTSNTAFTNDAGYLTEHQSLYGYATEQWVESQGYLTDADYPDLTGYATKEWVINQNYVTISELIQYITNLQNQIDSFKEQISGCCGDTGETIIRWVTMTGDNDYTCSGTTKMTKEKEQQSTDNGNTWTDTGNYRAGSTVLETNSTDCGYVAPLKFYGKVSSGNDVKVNCNSSTVLTKEEVNIAIGHYTAITIGDCVSSIAEKAFINTSNMIISLNIPGNVKTIGSMAFANSGISALTLNEGVQTLGEGAFKACSRLTAVTIPNSVKQLIGDTFYVNNIKTLIIGSGVTSIGNNAFARTSSVAGSTITVLATTPPTLGDNMVFNGWDNAPIYVPAASVNLYKAASGWSRYADRIQAIP